MVLLAVDGYAVGRTYCCSKGGHSRPNGIIDAGTVSKAAVFLQVVAEVRWVGERMSAKKRS